MVGACIAHNMTSYCVSFFLLTDHTYHFPLYLLQERCIILLIKYLVIPLTLHGLEGRGGNSYLWDLSLKKKWTNNAIFAETSGQHFPPW